MFSGSIRQWEGNGGGLLCMAVPAAISSYKTKSLARKTDSHTLTPIFFNVLCSVFPTLKKNKLQLSDKREEGLCTYVCVNVTVSCSFLGGCV